MTADYKDFRRHALLATLVAAHRARVITVAAACRLLRLQAHLGRITQDEFNSMCKRIARATNWGWEMLMPYGARHTTVARDSVESQDMRRAINKALEELKAMTDKEIVDGQRSYAEIVGELTSKPTIKAAYPVVERNENESLICLCDKAGTRRLQIWYQGEVDFFGTHALSYGELGAIYATCTELAAKWRSEHNE